ncbi:S8 family peptidase [Neorhizobium sp. DAR64860/K0K1]|uniref:S8 family peptidase n=1 Tax=Neorhizobium sp. DAR64860/K0K1 TaxID=3421955 RepID=UPI003D2D12F1
MRKYVIVRKQSPTRGPGKVRGLETSGGDRRGPIAYERLTESEAASIAAEPEVEAVAPAMPIRLIEPRQATTNSPGAAWGLDAVGATTSSFTGRGVVVAVLDTGIDASHPAFAGVEIEQRDFSGDGNGDRQGHGTHCAGTIFGRDVGGVRIGVAPGIQRALIGKVLGDNGGGNSEMIVDGINWALSRGANVISMSLGFDFPGMVASWIEDNWPPELATSNALEAYRVNLRAFDAVMNLTKARGGLGGGALIVAASGNESRRDEHPDWRISASLPAAADDVISVAAVGRDGERFSVANFSNSMALISAPGVDVLSAQVGGGLRQLSGTSMACPHVAGVAALWWEAIRKGGRIPTPTNVRAALIDKARRESFGPSYAEIDFGQGLVVAP